MIPTLAVLGADMGRDQAKGQRTGGGGVGCTRLESSMRRERETLSSGRGLARAGAGTPKDSLRAKTQLAGRFGKEFTLNNPR